MSLELSLDLNRLDAICQRAVDDFAALPSAIGRYRICGELGRGGMGVVFDAIDPVLDRSVAVKVIRLDSVRSADEQRELGQRLVREMRATSGLFHPNVLAIFDADYEIADSGVRGHYVMERIEGESLASRLHRDGTLDRAAGLEIAVAIASGLSAAHAHGIVHRDLKPSNILLPEGNDPKIADFGLCRVGNGAVDLTQSGAIVGSVHYLSPEQIDGKKVGAAADLFALGGILVRMFSGREPFAADSIVSHLDRIQGGAPSGLDALDAPLRALVERLLEKNPERRPGSASEVRAALLALSRGKSHPLTRSRRRPRGFGRVAAAVACGFLLAALGSDLGRTPASNPRIHDEAALLAPAEEREVADRLALFFAESGIDAQVLFDSPALGETTSAFATRKFQELGVGQRSPAGRGLLFVYDTRAEELRIEVGYSLEEFLPDPLVAYLLRDHARYLFDSGETRLALLLGLRVLQDHLRLAALGGEFDPRPYDALQALRYGSGGGGAGQTAPFGRNALAAFSQIGERGADWDFSAGATPQETHSLYLAWLAHGEYDTSATIFTEESRRYLAAWPMTRAYLDYMFLKESGQRPEVLERGDRALIFSTTNPFVFPHFLVKSDAGWQIDIAGEVREIINIAGGSHSWGLRSANAPQLAPFRDRLVASDGLIRIRGADNRRLRTFGPETMPVELAAQPRS